MRANKLPVILLAVWLILTGLSGLIGLSFSGLGTIMAVLAVVTGALLLWQGGALASAARWGTVLLAIWLILQGLVDLVNFSFAGLDVVLGALALAAGILIALGK